MNLQQRIVEADGRPTLDFVQELEQLTRDLRNARAALAAIAAVTAPTGGATVDAEARAAINAIIAAAS